MKIAFVLTQSLDSPSGLGRYGPLARELVRLGYEVEVIALHYAWQQLPQKSFVEQGVKINYVGQMHVQKEGSHKTYFSPSKLLWVAFTSTLRLAQAIAQSDADIIHLGKPQPFNVLAAKYGRRGRPLFCDCDDYEAETNKFSHAWQKKVVRYFEDHIVHIANGLTVNSRFLQNRYQKLGFPANKIFYVPNGIEHSRFANKQINPKLYQKWQLDPKAPIILYVGTLGMLSHPVDLLLQAFVTIQKVKPSTQLLLVGGGEDYDKLQQMAAQLSIARQTRFTGRVAAEDVPAYFGLATVSVDPVYDDLIAKARSPLKIVESLAMGTPVVTGDVGDRAQMLHDGKFGLTVSPGSAAALAKGILTLLNQPEQRMQMAQAALQEKDRWCWDRLVIDFSKVYTKGFI
jgi:glycosyltransferase involved in cell wall biosynthesis